jgi:hypothetical protein
MKIKTFDQFVTESDDFSKEEMNTFMKKKQKKKEEEASDTQKKLEDWEKEKSGTCPRCGKSEKECVCQEEDYYSTVNSYRVPGKKVKEYE